MRIGIRQFIDIGTGLPTQNNVHEVAQALAPETRVVYADNDPVVIAHGRALLSKGNTWIVKHDLRQPADILSDPQVRAAIDFAEPVGLLLVSVLHCVDTSEDPYAAVAALCDALPIDSHLVISHIPVVDDLSAQSTAVYNRRANTSMVSRTREEILAFFDRLTLLEPGLVHLHQCCPTLNLGTVASFAVSM